MFFHFFQINQPQASGRCRTGSGEERVPNTASKFRINSIAKFRRCQFQPADTTLLRGRLPVRARPALSKFSWRPPLYCSSDVVLYVKNARRGDKVRSRSRDSTSLFLIVGVRNTDLQPYLCFAKLTSLPGCKLAPQIPIKIDTIARRHRSQRLPVRSPRSHVWQMVEKFFIELI